MGGIGETTVVIELHEPRAYYAPGSRLSGQYRVLLAESDELRATELSLLWHTVGQGEEDMGVHHFQRQALDESAVEGVNRGSDARWPFESILPNSPLSYDGVIVKICWCVRLRVFLGRGREIVAEEPFRLGHVPPATMVVL